MNILKTLFTEMLICKRAQFIIVTKIILKKTNNKILFQFLPLKLKVYYNKIASLKCEMPLFIVFLQN